VYQLGEVVRVTMTVTNTSGQERYAFSGGEHATVNPTGRALVSLAALAAACPPRIPCGALLSFVRTAVHHPIVRRAENAPQDPYPSAQCGALRRGRSEEGGTTT
jgi:hypothetical protein